MALLLAMAKGWKTEYMSTQGKGTGGAAYKWVAWLFEVMEDPRNTGHQHHDLLGRTKEIQDSWDVVKKTFRYDVKDPNKRPPKPSHTRTTQCDCTH